jgi:hypothetical protein
MADTQPSASPAYLEYARSLKELHALIRQGEGDSEQADEIRDAMDGLWRLLTPEETDLARRLSASLASD